MLLLANTGVECQVFGFHDDLAPVKGIPIVTAVTAHDNNVTGETYMLIFGQALWFGPTIWNLVDCDASSPEPWDRTFR